MVGQHDPGFCGECAQPAERAMQLDAATVAGEPIGADGAAVRHALQGRECALDQVAAGHRVNLRDQTESATVLLVSRIVQPSGTPEIRHLAHHCEAILPETRVDGET